MLIVNMVKAAWGTLQQKFDGSLARIQECKANIELEAFAANIKGNVSRHEELKSLLLDRNNPKGPADPLPLNLPCRIISFPRNTKFCGRKENLEQIQQILILAQKSRKQASLALVGFGGAGKTQIALGFGWQHLDNFDIILWAQADSVAKLGLDFLAFGRRIGLVPATSTLEDHTVAELTKR